MMPIFLALVLAAVACGCSGHASHALGAPADGTPIAVSAVRQSAPGALVTVRGEMIKKCPVAGCWFILRDESGSIKVDTQAAGFVVVDVPLHRAMIVTGRLATNGTERFIDATGVRY